MAFGKYSEDFIDRLHSKIFFGGVEHPEGTVLEIAGIRFVVTAFEVHTERVMCEHYAMSTQNWIINWVCIWHDDAPAETTDFRYFGDYDQIARDLVKVKMFTCL